MQASRYICWLRKTVAENNYATYCRHPKGEQKTHENKNECRWGKQNRVKWPKVLKEIADNDLSFPSVTSVSIVVCLFYFSSHFNFNATLKTSSAKSERLSNLISEFMDLNMYELLA